MFQFVCDIPDLESWSDCNPSNTVSYPTDHHRQRALMLLHWSELSSYHRCGEFHSPSNVPAAPEQMFKGVPHHHRCSQVSSRGRCCSWPGRWSWSLQERGRSCRWGRRTPRIRPAPGRPDQATPCRRPAGDGPAEWCWRLKGSGGEKHQRHAGSHSNNIARGALRWCITNSDWWMTLVQSVNTVWQVEGNTAALIWWIRIKSEGRTPYLYYYQPW